MISSSVNKQTMISHENWAVTLTCDIGTFHAKLVFEGMGDETPESHFYQIAHLTGNKGFNPFGERGCFSDGFCGLNNVGSVELSEKKGCNGFKKNYRKKSETWVCSKEKIETLLLKISNEQKSGVPFHICGNKSMFSKDAEIFEIYDQVLGEIKKQDEGLFLALYDSVQNGGECTGMSREGFDKSISKTLKAVNAYIITDDLSYLDLIERVKTSARKLDQSQQNCFTWARGKLQELDIELNDLDFQNVISITTLMAKYNPDEDIAPCDCFDKCVVKKASEEENIGDVYERFFTYNTNRDKRTEEWKVIERKSSANQKISRAAQVSSILLGGLLLPAVIISPVLFALAGPVVGISVISGLAANQIVSRVAHRASSVSQEALLESVRTNHKLKQQGNNQENVKKIHYFVS